MQSEYTKDSISTGRRRLSQVLKRAGDLIRAEDVSQTLQIDLQDAHQLLSRWTKQGSLKRVSRGLYVPAPAESVESEHVLTDPWILVPSLYDPCYVGGRTAAEFWDLTEQIFRDIVVLTSAPIRSKRQWKHGALFTLKKISADHIYGTTTVWRSRTKVTVSDIHKTILDMLEFPRLGGGIQHVADCLQAYFSHEDCDVQKLFEYAKRRNNGAVFKRLGYLVARFSLDRMLEDACRSQLTAGLTKLDPDIKCPRIATKWRLRIPDSWVKQHD